MVVGCGGWNFIWRLVGNGMGWWVVGNIIVVYVIGEFCMYWDVI